MDGGDVTLLCLIIRDSFPSIHGRVCLRCLFFTVQPAPQEGASATEALSTNGINQEPSSKVLQLQMHLWVVLVDTVAKRTLEGKIEKLATIVVVMLQ